MNDLQIGEDFDLLLAAGDLQIGASRQQHALLLLASTQGDWRFQPAAGVNIVDYLNAPSTVGTRNALAAAIRRQAAADGLQPGIITIDNNFNVTFQ